MGDFFKKSSFHKKIKRKIKQLIKYFFSNVNDSVHNQSKRDIQAAIQGTCAFVFAALIGFKSSVKADLSPSWILVVMAPMLLGPGLGLAQLGPFEALSQGLKLDFISVEQLGPDLRIVARPAGRANF